jgi:hypothetical protein
MAWNKSRGSISRRRPGAAAFSEIDIAPGRVRKAGAKDGVMSEVERRRRRLELSRPVSKAGI